jgi:hypothetical protein
VRDRGASALKALINVYGFRKKLGFEARCYIIVIYLNVGYNIAIYLNVGIVTI